jgi:hypothetical protein
MRLFEAAKEKPAAFAVLVLAIAFLTSAHTPVNLPSCLPDTSRTDIAGAESVVRSYLAAVDRGELLSFGRRLSPADITPIRVQYNYQIAGGGMETRVYSELKDPMPVPDQPEYHVIGVCSAMEDGRIVETESHVLLK